METGRDNTVGAGVSLAIIIIAGLVLLYMLVSFLKSQDDLAEEQNTFFGTTSTTTVNTSRPTQTPATPSKPPLSGDVNIRIYESDRDGDTDIDEDNDTTSTTETRDNSVKPTTTVSPSVSPTVSPSPTINLPVTLPKVNIPLLNGLGL